jgi:hemerythrin HHE cation binding domain-containing protein
MTSYPPSKALHELQAQHDALRAIMDRCDELVAAFEAGEDTTVELTREVARLRVAFDAHNRFEEQLLRPVLLDVDAFGPVRVERMLEEHVGEHRAMRDQLAAGTVGELEAVIAMLRAHLAAEERYFLSSRVLRDDVINVESTG